MGDRLHGCNIVIIITDLTQGSYNVVHLLCITVQRELKLLAFNSKCFMLVKPYGYVNSKIPRHILIYAHAKYSVHVHVHVHVVFDCCSPEIKINNQVKYLSA